MYSISGNKIHWPANDVTPVILKCVYHSNPSH